MPYGKKALLGTIGKLKEGFGN